MVGLQKRLELPTEGLGVIDHLGPRWVVCERLVRPRGQVMAMATNPARDPQLGHVPVPLFLDYSSDLGRGEGGGPWPLEGNSGGQSSGQALESHIDLLGGEGGG